MKYTNTHICVFSGSATSQGWGSNPISVFFFYKVLYNYCSNFFSAFCPKKWRSKTGFPIVFSKSDFGEGGRFLCQNCFLTKPNTPEYAQVLVVTWAKLNSVTALLSPCPKVCDRFSHSYFLLFMTFSPQLENNKII